jgi:hypothetical protein
MDLLEDFAADRCATVPCCPRAARGYAVECQASRGRLHRGTRSNLLGTRDGVRHGTEGREQRGADVTGATGEMSCAGEQKSRSRCERRATEGGKREAGTANVFSSDPARPVRPSQQTFQHLHSGCGPAPLCLPLLPLHPHMNTFLSLAARPTAVTGHKRCLCVLSSELERWRNSTIPLQSIETTRVTKRAVP